MLKRRHDNATITIEFEGELVQAAPGDSVAVAVLAAAGPATRITPVSGAPRGPYCMMGICFECLMEIDGWPNRQACMITVREGMSVRRQDGAVQLRHGGDKQP